MGKLNLMPFVQGYRVCDFITNVCRRMPSQDIHLATICDCIRDCYQIIRYSSQLNDRTDKGTECRKGKAYIMS